ncbi:MAG: hypothetical protein J0H46_15760 [Bacteroidetes bacterium]|nr:hypothetical protein [Bacteroidota bacterium]
MNIAGLIFLILMHFFSGRGLLYLFNIKTRLWATIALSMITGILIIALIPMLLDLFFIPITTENVIISTLLVTILLNSTQVKKYRISTLKHITSSIKSITLTDALFLLLFILLMIPSVWRCFYFPAYARDILSGPEIIAEYTLREKTMINSVFSLNLETTNNHLKPPFVSGLQIVYKMLVHPFGELWLSILSGSFLIWLFSLMREKLHPAVAGFCLLLFIAIPEMYAYTYILLFDYANAIMFSIGIYFFLQYVIQQKANYFFFSTLMFGFATFIRSETLVLICMLLPMILFFFYKEKLPVIKRILYTGTFVIVPFIFYYVWMGIFIKYYLPIKFNVGDQVNTDFSHVNIFFSRLSDLTSSYLLGGNSTMHYAYFINVFCIILLTDVIVYRKFNTEARILLYSILVLYIGIPLLGFLIPWYDLDNTSKRALFKMFPLMLLYFRNSMILQALSRSIINWESPQTKSVQATIDKIIPQMAKPKPGIKKRGKQ